MKTLQNLLDTFDASCAPWDNNDIKDALSGELDTSLDELNRDTLRDLMYDYANTRDIIYSRDAMKYLSENDMSLGLSLTLAHEMGYELKDLSSEILASILQQDEYNQGIDSVLDDIMDAIDEEVAS